MLSAVIETAPSSSREAAIARSLLLLLEASVEASDADCAADVAEQLAEQLPRIEDTGERRSLATRALSLVEIACADDFLIGALT